MLLVKIGGSLIAPKNIKGIDEEYLGRISSFFLNYKSIFITHGTGNIGHGWVKNLIDQNSGKDLKTLIIKNYLNGKNILNEYFNKISRYFPGFKRISIEYFISKSKTIFSNGKFIIGGDILDNGEIISSDDIIGKMIGYEFVNLVLVLTDVNGVYDENGNIIEKITKYNIDKIKFWDKENDVTGSMKQKVLKILDSGKKAIICNGKDLTNIKNWLEKGNGIGTIIL